MGRPKIGLVGKLGLMSAAMAIVVGCIATRSRERIRLSPTPSEGMVFVPAGAFLMGSQKGREDEKPAREVYLGGFYRKFCRKLP